jgi:hypothetical protein
MTEDTIIEPSRGNDAPPDSRDKTRVPSHLDTLCAATKSRHSQLAKMTRVECVRRDYEKNYVVLFATGY